jgi:hypothetical protein
MHRSENLAEGTPRILLSIRLHATLHETFFSERAYYAASSVLIGRAHVSNVRLFDFIAAPRLRWTRDNFLRVKSVFGEPVIALVDH